MSEAALRARWRDLVERRLPEAARSRPDWPIRSDHCFGRVLLDNALGRPWREVVAAPAWRNTPESSLSAALALGQAVVEGHADLAALNRRSLALRSKLRGERLGGQPSLSMSARLPGGDRRNRDP